ncbi:uncharacterized protein AKAME5_000748800 [Lates japonicus]|uniref:Uncharacterized protein n=1 Tax=Lates japonicus TaxID=270547 RepID=A0AAD3MI14_LATJO|nr:uncharacterized protein AKAME5_000748800 [Lates japonicus]
MSPWRSTWPTWRRTQEGGPEQDWAYCGTWFTCKEQMRNRVINDREHPERDFIKHLKDICEVMDMDHMEVIDVEGRQEKDFIQCEEQP